MKAVGLTIVMFVGICWAQDVLPMMPGIQIVKPEDIRSEQPLEIPQLSEEERLIRCKRPLCDMMCAYGFAVGEDGCPVCRCKTPEDLCRDLGDCPEGSRCHVPTCFGELCASVKAKCIPECPMMDCSPCPGGIYRKDERGCQTCQCEALPCPMPMCSEPCEFGYANNELGCMTCNCNKEPQESKSSSSEHVEGDSAEGSMSKSEEGPVKDGCSLAMCRMFCPHGFDQDEHGCDICKCRRQPKECPDVMCMMFCDAGFEKDERGCDICRCKHQPLDCPRRMCRMMKNCPNGFERDERGCETCMCKPYEEADVCKGVECLPGLTCKAVMPFNCMRGMGNPTPQCRPPSICELHQGHMMEEDQIEMMMHHLSIPEQEKFFAGPAMCQPDGSFEPKQCFHGQCFCVDDRSVMQLMSLMMNAPECRNNITKEMRLTFQLVHDLDDNDLDSALREIEELVKDTLGDWMAIGKDSVVLVEVAYMDPGLLSVQCTLIQNGVSDLSSASHYMHRLMHDGRCNLNYKQHVLHPVPNTVQFQHLYDNAPAPAQQSRLCWGHMCYNRPMFAFCAMGVIMFVGILAMTLLIVWKRRRLLSYQFKHRRLEDKENFRKNLVLGSELEKPQLLGGDDVKVTLTDAMEKPIA